MDLFRSWDDDESGCVDKHEFRSAIRRLTVSQHIGGEEVAEALFDLIDVRPACSTKPSCPRDPIRIRLSALSLSLSLSLSL